MMTKKAPKQENNPPSIQISRSRVGGKKRPDLFARLRNDEHPLDSLLPADSRNDSRLDIQEEPKADSQSLPIADSRENSTTDSRIAEGAESPEITNGYPQAATLDSPTGSHGYPLTNGPDIHSAPSGYHETTQTDSRDTITGYPHTSQPAIRELAGGYPTPANTASPTLKPDIRTATQQQPAASLISTVGNADIRTSPEPKTLAKGRSKKGVFLRTNDDITVRFKQFCIGQGWDFSQGTEFAWTRLMDQMDSRAGGEVDSMIALDERRMKMLYKSESFIINLYLRYNAIFNELAGKESTVWQAKWTASDDAAGSRFNDLPPTVIELGIIQTQLQKKIGSGRINTFKYYVDEIGKVIASGVSEETLGSILGYHRQMWKAATGREVDLSFLNPSPDATR